MGTRQGFIWKNLASSFEKWLETDRTLVELAEEVDPFSNVEADVSAEPDIVFVSDDSIDRGRVCLISKAKGRGDRYTEIEGSPDMVAEIVSDNSVKKDTKHLHKAYLDARIPEYWLVDARRNELVFRIHRQGTSGYEAAIRDDQGYQYSEVFQCWFRLDRHRDKRGNWKYNLRDKEINGAIHHAEMAS